MSSSSDSQRKKTSVPEAFSVSPEQFPEASEIKKGGGSRRFFRANAKAEQSGSDVPAVFCFYDDSKEENRYYAGLARFLKKIGVPAPEILVDVPEKNFFAMEDLGETDLWTLAHEKSHELVPAYKSALAGLARLHTRGLAELDATGTPIMRDGFNWDYYLWECAYFMKNAVEDGLKIPLSEKERVAVERDFAHLVRSFTEQEEFFPRQLVHRDCQSQNILWKNGTAYFIDFQGMRVGTGLYDVASLLFDPYVDFSDDFRRELFDFYENSEANLCRDKFSYEQLCFVATQRLMQAIGAYFFLSEKMGKRKFRAYVLPALKSLVATATGCERYHSPAIAELAQKMVAAEKLALGL